jgi:hypothetical protein
MRVAVFAAVDEQDAAFGVFVAALVWLSNWKKIF